MPTIAEALEQADVLDSAGETVGKAVRDAVPRGTVKDALAGTWLGHAVHPPLTDVVIGSFLGASLLDVLAPGSPEAANRLVGIGITAAVPTALTGANDWADTEIADPRVRRVGLIHAAANVSALGLYAASVAARRNGARARASALTLAGAAVLTFSGYLGGHLSFTRGVGPNQTAFDPGPDEWTPVMAASELGTNVPKAGVANETPVFLLRHPDGIHAIHDRCSHRGCLLSDGQVDGHIVTCACHGSQFDVTDGSLRQGPATTGQPSFEAREHEGTIEVRLRSGG